MSRVTPLHSFVLSSFQQLAPQLLALSLIARIPPQYAVWSCLIGCLLYTLIGGAKDVLMGPTTVIALIVAESTISDDLQNTIDRALILTLVAASIEIMIGVLRWGFIVNFISQPIIAGYSTAAAFNVATAAMGLIFYGYHVSG